MHTRNCNGPPASASARSPTNEEHKTGSSTHGTHANVSPLRPRSPPIKRARRRNSIIECARRKQEGKGRKVDAPQNTAPETVVHPSSLRCVRDRGRPIYLYRQQSASVHIKRERSGEGEKEKQEKEMQANRMCRLRCARHRTLPHPQRRCE
jgi:hypothetical protein